MLGLITILVIVAVAFWGVGLWLWWWFPRWQMRSITAADPKARADIEDNFRKTIGQALGGIAVLIAAGIAYYGTLQTSHVNEDQRVSNQVAKGFEQLGSKKLVVRLGGIYALEGVMNTSEQYHQPVLEALSAFVRDGTINYNGDGPPATDVQAALTVIGRRAAIGAGVPDLANAHIPKAYLRGDFRLMGGVFGADLSKPELLGANLRDADLRQADLSGADRRGADLRGANLSDAILASADLRGATLLHTNLSRAHLVFGANLSGADLFGTNLIGAILNDPAPNLRGANLNGANLNGANLRRAKQSGAILTGAKLIEADLSGAIVLQMQLDEACGTNVKLDPGLTIKPC